MLAKRLFPVVSLALAVGVYAAATSLTPPSPAPIKVESNVLVERTSPGSCAAFAAVRTVVKALRGHGAKGVPTQEDVASIYRATLCLQDAMDNHRIVEYLNGKNVCECPDANERVDKLLEYFGVPLVRRDPKQPGTYKLIEDSLAEQWPPIVLFSDKTLALITKTERSGTQVELTLENPDDTSDANRAWSVTAGVDDGLEQALEQGAVVKTIKELLFPAPCVKVNVQGFGNAVYDVGADVVTGVSDPRAANIVRVLAPYVYPNETVSFLGEYPDKTGSKYELVTVSSSPQAAEVALANRLGHAVESPGDPAYFVLDKKSGRFADANARVDVIDHRSLKEFASTVQDLPNRFTPEMVGTLALLWGYEKSTTLGGVIGLVLGALVDDERARIYEDALKELVLVHKPFLIKDVADFLEKVTGGYLTAVDWGDKHAFEVLGNLFNSARMSFTILIRWHPERREELLKWLRAALKGKKFCDWVAGLGSGGSKDKLKILSAINFGAKAVSGCLEAFEILGGADDIALELRSTKDFVSDKAVRRAFEEALNKIADLTADTDKWLKCSENAALSVAPDLIAMKIAESLGRVGIALAILNLTETILLNSTEVEPVARLAFGAAHIERLLHEIAFGEFAQKLQSGNATLIDYQRFRAAVHLALLLEQVGWSNIAAVFNSASRMPMLDEKTRQEWRQLAPEALNQASESKQQADNFLLPDVVLSADASGFLRIWALDAISHEECLEPCGEPTIVGTVLDESGAPITNAFVTLWSGDRLLKQVSVDPNSGAFGFCHVGDGEYDLRAAARGFCAKVSNVKVAGGKQSPNPVEFRLSKADLLPEDFYSLVASGKVKAEIRAEGKLPGYGQIPVTVQLANLTCQDLDVLLAAGTTLRNDSPWAQNLVVGRDTRIFLRSGQSSEPVSIGTYCISYSKGPPGGKTLRPDPSLSKPEYRRILLEASRSKVDETAPQAVQNAVWHFSDNVSIAPGSVEAKLVAVATPERRPLFITRVSPKGAAWSFITVLGFGMPLLWYSRRFFPV